MICSLAKQMSYGQRAFHCKNRVAKKLFQIMEEKQTNLAASLDVFNKASFLQIAEEIAPYICMLKTHVDLIEDFDHQMVSALQLLAEKHNFILFEDRKFADIGKIAKSQYEGGIYKISSWAHLVTVHSVAGPGTIEGLREAGLQKERGGLLLAEMSSQGSLATGAYSQKTIAMAKEYSDFAVGFITQRRLLDDPWCLHMTPGINLEESKDGLRQQYTTPDEAIYQRGTDVIIVGSGILKASDKKSAAKNYQKAGWDAYQKRFSV